MARVAETAAFAKGSRIRHVVGGNAGSGYEWVPAAAHGLKAGVTALELDHAGQISRLTTVYDGRRLDRQARREFATLAFEP